MDKFLTTNRQKALLLAATSAFIWGATAPIMKLTLTQVPIFSLVAIRMGIASLIMIPFVIKNLKIDKEDRVLFLWSALTGITIHLTLFFIGLKLSQAIYAAFLAATVPVMTLFAATIFLKEKLTPRIIIASAVALFGVLIIIGKPNGALTLQSFIGNIILIISAAFWVVHEIIAKNILKKYSAQTLTFYTMAIGAITVLPMALIEFINNPAWTQNISTSGFAGILYGIIFASFIAHWAWQKGLSLLPAGEASFFFYIDPVSGAILAMLLLGEKLTLPLVAGGILISVSVILAENKRRAHPLHRKYDP